MGCLQEEGMGQKGTSGRSQTLIGGIWCKHRILALLFQCNLLLVNVNLQLLMVGFSVRVRGSLSPRGAGRSRRGVIPRGDFLSPY